MSATHLPRWLTALLVGPASVALAAALPGLVITVYAWTARDPERIGSIALTVAEPLALLAALGTTGLAAYATARHSAKPTRWGILLGSVAALCILGAALRVNDVDGWTGVALGLLPLAGLVGARGAAKRNQRRREASSMSARTLPFARKATGALTEPGFQREDLLAPKRESEAEFWSPQKQ